MSGSSESRGIILKLKALLGSILQHGVGFISLVGWEGREAGIHYLRLMVILFVTLFLFLIGYVLLLLFFILLFAWWLGIAWIWMILTLAIIHVGAVLMGVRILARGIRKPIFESTISELKKDIAEVL